jgi:hypothetical protein
MGMGGGARARPIIGRPAARAGGARAAAVMYGRPYVPTRVLVLWVVVGCYG